MVEINIISEEAMRIFNGKEFMRRKVYAFCLQFPKKNKMEILESFTKRSHNFIILDGMETKTNSRITMYKVVSDKETIEEVLSQIDREEFDKLEVITKEPSKDYQYLFFIKRVGVSFEDELIEDIVKDDWAEYKFRLIQNYASEYVVSDTYYYNCQQVIEMTKDGEVNTGEIKIYEHLKRKPSADIVTTLGGIGDNFIVFSLIHEFARRKHEQGRELYIMLADKNEMFKGHDLFFYGEYPLVKYGSLLMNNLFKSRKASNLVDLNVSFAKKVLPGHICNHTKKVLGIEESFDPYTHKAVLEEMIKNGISDEEFKYIDEITSKENLIGFQYFTGQDTGNVISNNPTRNWKRETVIHFVELCKENGLELLALNPNPYGMDLGIPQLMFMSVPAYAYTISKLSLMVGIDSSGGHIASFYNIPSITIWGKQSPIDAFGKPISFRAMRYNYSLWSENLDINCVTPKLVMEKILAYRNGTLEISDRIISYEDSMNLYQIEIVKDK